MDRLGEIHSIVTADNKVMYMPSSGVKLIAYGTYGAPPVNYVTRKLHAQDGVTELNFTVEPRNIPVRMYKEPACSRLEYWNNRSRLHEFFRPNRNGKLKLNVILPTGDIRTLDVRADPGMEFSTQTEDNAWHIDETLNFIAFNPIWYDPTVKTAHTSGFYGSDLIFDTEFPIEFGPEGLQFVSQVNYLGTWRTYPTVELLGPYFRAVISNETTGKEIVLDVPIALGEKRILTLTPGETSIVDEDGNYCFGDLGPTSDLMDFTIKPVPEVPEGSNEGPYYQRTQSYSPIRYYRHGEPDGEVQAVDFGTEKVTGLYYGGYSLDHPGPLGEDLDTAVYFDGSGADVNLSTIDFSGSSYTFEFFLRPETQAGDSPIITVTYDSGKTFIIYLTVDGRLTVLNDALSIQTAANAVPEGTWTHCAVVFAQSSGVTNILINGSLSTGGIIGPIGLDVTSVVMGLRTAGAYTPYVGYQDEFAIYLRSFTAAEMYEKYLKTKERKSLYSVGGKQILRVTLLGSEGSGYYNAVISNNPMRYYRMGDISGVLASDSGYDSVYGTYMNGVTLNVPGAVPGDTNTAVRLDGSNDTIFIPSPNLKNVSFTVEFFVKLDASPLNPQNLWQVKDAAGTNSTYLMVYPDSTIEMVYESGVRSVSATGFTYGEWNHVAVTYDPNTQISVIYLNGTAIVTGGVGVGMNGQCDEFWIGTTDGTSDPSEGDFDEFAIYPIALSSDIIQAHYNAWYRRYASDAIITYHDRYYGI